MVLQQTLIFYQSITENPVGVLLETLEKQVNADQSQNKRKSRQRALTTLVMELMAKLEQLETEISSRT